MMVWSWEGWVPTGLCLKDMLHMNEYLFGSQTLYVEGIGQVLSCAVALQPHQVMGMMMIMMF